MSRMLARRLMVFALVLLVVTTISSAFAPRRETSAPSQREPAPRTGTAGGVTVERTIDASDEDVPTISLEAGDRLKLTVRSDDSDAVELDGLGTLKAIAPLTDVVFDIVTSSPGRYPVVLVDEARTIANVRVVGAG